MAIQLTMQTDYGLIFPNGYVHIKEIFGDKEQITARVRIYASKNFKDVGGKGIDLGDYSFVPDLTKTNFIQQAYEYLMTLEPFNAGEVI